MGNLSVVVIKVFVNCRIFAADAYLSIGENVIPEFRGNVLFRNNVHGFGTPDLLRS